MKKILVSGCINCPYFKVWNDGEGKISHGECEHPSFYVKVHIPTIGIPRRIFYCVNETGRLEPGGIPNWCPLPNEPIAYYPTCTTVD